MQMFVCLNVWLMLSYFQDVWQTTTSFPRKQQCLRSSSDVQCLGLQNMCSMFHTVPSRPLRKMFFLPLVLHIRPDCPHPDLRNLLTFCLCYSLSRTVCLGSYPCSKRCSRRFSLSSPCALLGFLSHLPWKSIPLLPPEPPCQNKVNKQSLYPCCATAGFLKEHYT